ncbi:1220_t:CDS:2 [Cetraspora pellucida]|uniref:1220_t:CDS:1 n=1 Tax=Cetraspora pellucida TaxID=1433469 RepID=A0ACA9M4E2_9GLOM|nr:1220_t:CDS:2 [Cetraspora pellucida]
MATAMVAAVEAINYVAASWNEVNESTIVNCWTKTGILPSLSNNDVELVQNKYLKAIEYEESEISELVIDLTDPMVSQEIKSYQEINSTYIPMEEILNDNQIVETVLVEQLECQQGDPDDSNDEPSKFLLMKH